MDNFDIYLKSLNKYPEYTSDDSQNAINNIKKIKEALIIGNLKLVVNIATHMHKNWPSLDIMDYIQEGNETLINIVDKYDDSLTVKFTTFASFCVRKQILRFIKDNIAPVRLFNSASQRAVFANLSEIKTELEEGGFTEEIAVQFGVDAHDINTLLNSKDTRDLSEDDLYYDGPEEQMIKNEATKVILRKIHNFRKTLNEIELVIFDDILYLPSTTLAKIADFHKVSRQYAWKIKEDVILKAQKYFSKEDLKTIME